MQLRPEHRGGIGRASAKRLAKHGFRIAIHYNSAKSVADELASELHQTNMQEHKVFQADLSTYDGVRSLYADVVKEMGNPDVLFNNAGVTTKTIGADGNIEDVTPEDFEMTWRTNTGTHFLVRPVDSHRR